MHHTRVPNRVLSQTASDISIAGNRPRIVGADANYYSKTLGGTTCAESKSHHQKISFPQGLRTAATRTAEPSSASTAGHYSKNCVVLGCPGARLACRRLRLLRLTDPVPRQLIVVCSSLPNHRLPVLEPHVGPICSI